MKKYLYEDATHDLERDLKLLSLKIGPLTYIRTSYLLSRKNGMNKSDMQKLVRKIISELLIPHIRSEQAVEESKGSASQ